MLSLVTRPTNAANSGGAASGLTLRPTSPADPASDVFQPTAATGSTSRPVYQRLDSMHDPIFGEVVHYRLANGTEFYGVPRKNVPLVTYGVVFHKAGAGNETPGNNGITHFLEHLIFKGTKNLGPGQASRQLEALGLGLNAHTGRDKTVFPLYTVPKDNLVTALPIHADMLQHPEIPKEELEKERSVVIEEIRMYADKPDSRAQDNLVKQVWHPHPYSQTIAGPEDNIRHVGRDELLAYHKAHYGGNQRIIVAVGDFEPDALAGELAKQFGSMPAQPLPVSKNSSEAQRSSALLSGDLSPTENEQLTSSHLQLPQLAMGWNLSHTLPVKTQVALELANTWLSGDPASPLFQRLVEGDKPVASHIETGIYRLPERNMAYLEASLRGEQPAEVARDHIADTLQHVLAEGMNNNDLHTLKQAYKAGMLQSVESQNAIFKHMTSVVTGVHYLPGDLLKALEQLTVDEVNAVARKAYAPEHQKTTLIVPEPDKKTTEPPQPVFAGGMKGGVQPRFGGRLEADQQSYPLPTGQTALITQQPGNPRLAVSVVLPGQGRHNASIGLLSDWLNRGADGLSMVDWQNALKQDSLGLSISPTPDGLSITMSGLAEKKPILLKRLRQLLASPNLSLSEHAVVRQQTRDQLQSVLDGKPGARLASRLTDALYPAEHPYGGSAYRALQWLTDSQPSSQADNPMTAQALKDTWQTMRHGPAVTVSAVGDGIQPEELAGLFEGLRVQQSRQATSLPKPDPIAENKTLVFTEPGLKQAQVQRIWRAPTVKASGNNAFRLMDDILSGGLSSRLFVNFREKEPGLCYAVSSAYNDREGDGTFKLSIGTDPIKVKRVLEKFDDEMHTLLTSEPAREEMAKVLNYAQSRVHAANELTEARSVKTGLHVAHQQPSPTERLEQMARVTPDDIQQASQQWLSQPSLTGILTPPPATSEPPGLA